MTWAVQTIFRVQVDVARGLLGLDLAGAAVLLYAVSRQSFGESWLLVHTDDDSHMPALNVISGAIDIVGDFPIDGH